MKTRNILTGREIAAGIVAVCAAAVLAIECIGARPSEAAAEAAKRHVLLATGPTRMIPELASFRCRRRGTVRIRGEKWQHLEAKAEILILDPNRPASEPVEKYAVVMVMAYRQQGKGLETQAISMRRLPKK